MLVRVESPVVTAPRVISREEPAGVVETTFELGLRPLDAKPRGRAVDLQGALVRAKGRFDRRAPRGPLQSVLDGAGL